MRCLDNWYNRRLLKRFGVQYEQFPTINGRLFIEDYSNDPEGFHGTIKLGKGVVFNSSFESNPVGGVRTAIMIKSATAVLEIDDRAGMSNVLIGVLEHVHIGKDVNIGGGAKIFDNDFHSLVWEERKAFWDRTIRSKPVIIGDRSFIGTEAIIMKGVTIGAEAVIGAGAVVSRDVGPGEIWAGNPAKFIKRLPNWTEDGKKVTKE